MIGYLKGRVLLNQDGRMIVVVSASSGAFAGADSGVVGYSVMVPGSAEYSKLSPGASVELFIHTHVREDALDLYGFSTAREKELFLALMGVNGIGPKVALGILSAAAGDALIAAVLEGDKAFLTDLPGIGKKTAERMILELADPIRKRFGAEPAVAPKGAASVAARDSAILRDAKAALMSLGYREPEAARMLNRAVAAFDGEPGGVEDLIKTALQGGN